MDKCGGICTEFNSGMCMNACLMDTPAKNKLVEREMALRESIGVKISVHGALGTNKVLKPINPNAHAMFNKPENIEPINRDVTTSILQDDVSELRQFRL